MRKGLPVTPAARTLVDLATMASLERVRGAVAEADFRHLLDLEAIDRLTGVGGPGSSKLRRALARHRPEYARTRSRLEDLFLDLCRRHRLPFPAVNVKVGIHTVDALWRDERLIVEPDGGEGHASYGQMQRDRGRDLDLRRADYLVLRYTWRQVTCHRAAVAADIRRALRERGHLRSAAAA
jgi:very-short-patch-repair endonuclease